MVLASVAQSDTSGSSRSEVRPTGCAAPIGKLAKSAVLDRKSEKSPCRVGDVERDYVPFITEGFVSLVGSSEKVAVKILRDTGASESFILESVLPFSRQSSTGCNVLIKGIGLQTFSAPLHRVVLQSELVQGEVTIAVRPLLPVVGVGVLLGNNLAGGKVWRDDAPAPVVKNVPSFSEPDACVDFPDVFPSCAVTRANEPFFED